MYPNQAEILKTCIIRTILCHECQRQHKVPKTQFSNLSNLGDIRSKEYNCRPTYDALNGTDQRINSTERVNESLMSTLTSFTFDLLQVWMMSLNTATTYRIISNLNHLYKDRVNITIRQYDRFLIPCLFWRGSGIQQVSVAPIPAASFFNYTTRHLSHTVSSGGRGVNMEGKREGG